LAFAIKGHHVINRRNIFIIFKMKFIYNMFQCKISTSAEALLGLSNDVSSTCKEILNICKVWMFD
jgi:hypothetical protein